MPFDNPFQNNSPIMGPWLKAMQAYTMLQNLKNDAADRQYRAEELGFRREQLGATNARADQRLQFDMGKEGYDRSHDAIARTVELVGKGGVMGSPQVETFLDTLGKVKDPRQRIDIEGGQSFYMPTAREQKQTKLQEVIDKNSLGTAEAVRAQALLAPGKLKEELARREIELRYPNPKNPPAPHYVPGEGGAVTAVEQQPDGSFKQTPLGNIGKVDKGDDLGKQAEVERRRIQGIIERARKASELVRVHELNSDTKWTAQQENDYLNAKTQSEILWAEAAREAETAAANYPDHLEGGAGEGGYAYIQPRKRK